MNLFSVNVRGSVIGVAVALSLAGCSSPASQDDLAAANALAFARSIPEPAFAGAPTTMRLATTRQYLNTLAYVFGPSINLDVNFPPLERTRGLLANGAAIAGVTPSQLEQYQRTAANLASQVIREDRRRYSIPCQPKSDKAADAVCASQYLGHVGRLIFRRPMSEAELRIAVRQAGETADSLQNFYSGISVALEGMLISPDVLFITENAEPDPAKPGQQRLDGYSLAARLSYFLWNAAPDHQLLAAAETGQIHDKKELARIVNRMMASPRLEDGVRAFFDDMFEFDRFATLAKDPTVYPFFTGVTAADAREQTLRTVIKHLIDDQKDYRDLYTTRETFISPALAALYKLPARPGWTPYEFPAGSPRQGLLTQISFLASHSHPGRSSPTLRGKALREVLLCQPVPPPPANVDFSLVNNPKLSYPTQRDRVNAHLENPVCAGCHKITDPMGLALESFDGAGRYRETENGNAIDTSGTLDGKPFTNVTGLSEALRNHPSLPTCLVERVFSYASGSAADANTRDLRKYYSDLFAQSGYKLPDLLRAVALSDAFSKVAPAASPGNPGTVSQSTAGTAQ